MSSGVYLITNKVNNKKYVGCSINIEQRWQKHIWESSSKKSKGYNYSIHRAFRKYRVENFDFSILEKTDNTYERERFWISKLDSYNNGYNETEGGDCGPVRVGEENGMAILSIADVISIRQRLLAGEMPSHVYLDYSTKISPRGFEHVWQGDVWLDVVPEAIAYVKSEEYIKKVRSFASSSRNGEIRNKIQEEKGKGRHRLDVYEEFKETYSLSGFNKVWYKK